MTKSESWNMAMDLIKSKADLNEIYGSEIIRHYLLQCGFALTGGISIEQDRTFKSLTDTATGDWWEVMDKQTLINLLS